MALYLAALLICLLSNGGCTEETSGTEDLADDNGWLGIGKMSFKPYPSVGVLSDMQSFFENLRNNLDYLETLPEEERQEIFGPPTTVPEKEVNPRMKGAALYFQNQRPSYKIRNYVNSAELRGTHRYDPSLLWTGLGKRR